MTPAFEALHPRSLIGRFTAKHNTAPASSLTRADERPCDAAPLPATDGSLGHFTVVSQGAVDRGDVVELTEAEYDAKARPKYVSRLRAGDKLLWREETTEGTRFWAEEILDARRETIAGPRWIFQTARFLEGHEVAFAGTTVTMCEEGPNAYTYRSPR